MTTDCRNYLLFTANNVNYSIGTINLTKGGIIWFFFLFIRRINPVFHYILTPKKFVLWKKQKTGMEAMQHLLEQLTVMYLLLIRNPSTCLKKLKTRRGNGTKKFKQGGAEINPDRVIATNKNDPSAGRKNSRSKRRNLRQLDQKKSGTNSGADLGTIMKAQLKAGQYTLKPAEVIKLINAADSLRDMILIKLMARAGLRRDEAVSLDIRDIDFDRRRLEIIGKGFKGRTIPVAAEILQDITFYIGPRKKGPVFRKVQARGKQANLANYHVNRILKDTGNRAGLKNPNPRLKNINPHCLRHTFARTLKDKGVSIEVIQNIMGHSSYKTTMDVYGLLSIDEMQSKLEAVL